MMRRLLSVAACLAVAASTLVLVPVATPTAEAVTANVAFSADELPTWQANERAWAVASTDNGLVVVGGGFSQLRPPAGTSGSPINRRALAVLNAETGSPTSCVLDTTLSGGTGQVRAAVTAADGRTVYIAGNFTEVGGVARTRVAAINPVTCSVLPFRVSSPAGPIWSLALHDNTLYMGGIFNQVAGQTRNKYAAVNATTGALLPWTANAALAPNRPSGTVADGWAVAVSPTGDRVALGGEFDTVNGVASQSLSVVDATSGNVVRAYDNGFFPSTSVTKGLTTDGTTLYGGNEGTGGGVFDGRFAIDWNTLDQKWRDTCLGATQAVLVHDDTLYSANHSHDCSSIDEFQDGRRVYLVAQDAENRNHYGWEPKLNDGIGEGIGPRALAVATGATSDKDYLWVTGEFTRVNGIAQQSITRFGPDDVGAPPVPVTNAEAMPDGSVQVRFLSVVDPDDARLTYRVYRNGSAMPVWTGTADSQWWIRPQVTFRDTDVTPGTSYSYRVTASDGPNTSALSTARTATATTPGSGYTSTVLDADPDLYWRYDGSSAGWVQDQSGATTTGRNGLAEQGYSYGTDGVGGDGSLTLDGSSGYVWNDQPRPGPNTYTIQTWFRTTTGSGGKIVGYGNGRPRTDTGQTQLSGSYDRHIYMENSGRLRFGIYNGGTATVRTDRAYNDGQWHQVVATQDSNGLQLYVDGQPVGSNPANNAQPYQGVWHVGGDQLNGWPDQPSSNFFAGSIDETAVYDRALSRAEIAGMYTAGGGDLELNDAPDDEYGAAVFADEPDFYWPFDETSGTTTADASYFGTNPGTVGQAAQLGQPGQVSGARAVRLVARDDSTIHAPQSGALRSFTAETWVKTTRGGKLIGFENTPTGNGSGYDKQIYMADDGRITFGVYTGSVQTARSGTGFNDDRWHHVVGTQDSSGLKLYVDGVLRGQNPTTTSETGAGFWRVGGGNLGGWPDTPSNTYLDGQLDDTAVYPRALTQAEVTEHYALGSNDTLAPTVPADLAAQVDGSDVELSWTAATDASGVTGYQVHRGTSEGFTPSDDTLVGEPTGTTFTDEGVAPGTYFYTVLAVDGAGNVSDPADPVEATVLDTQAPTAPTDLAVTVQGATADLSWTAATDDSGVEEYQVHRSTTAGFTPGASTLVDTTDETSFSDTGLSRGTYYYTVVAVDAAGNTGPAAEEVEAEVADVTAPSVPGGVSTEVDGSDVTIGWTASTDDVGVAGYQVHRGSSAGFTVSEDNRVGSPTTTSFTEEDVPAGSWFYKVVAIDAAGNASSASTGAGAVVADTTAPTAPSGLTAAVEETTVSLSWTAATDDVGVVGYRVHRGTTEGFTPNQQNQITGVTGTSATDSGVAPGTYWYKVVAVDAAGNIGAPSNAARAVVEPMGGAEPVVQTVPAAADAMVVQAAAGTNYGSNTQVSTRGGSSQLEAYLAFDLPQTPAGLSLTGASLRVRTSTDPTAASADVHTLRVLNGSFTESSVTWANRPTSLGATVGSLQAASTTNTAYTAELDAAGLRSASGTRLSLVMQDSNGSDNLRLWSREAGNTTYRPQLVLSYTPSTGGGGPTDPEPAPDTTAPSATGAISTSVSGSSVAVSWGAATDNVGVTGYRVHRGSSAGFTPGTGNLVDTVTATQATETGVPAGTWYYRVVAVDEAGNVGPSAAAAAATVTGTAEPVEVVVPAAADAMVVQAASGTNYGSNTQISSRGGSSAIESYLAFEIPAAPAGQVLSGATLRVRTSTDPTATSTDPHRVRRLNDTFTESEITWANRPTDLGDTLGTLSGATATNTAYTVDLDPAGLRQTGTVSLVMQATSGSDNLRLWSRDAGNAGYRPQLVLTYVAGQ